jgi:hypothetical protein
VQDEAFIEKIVDVFRDLGPHPEYSTFARSVQIQTMRDAFTFIRDACEGTGGFQDGTYLDPHKRELVRAADPATILLLSSSQVTAKMIWRMRLADYDNFARRIESAYWSYISQSRDLVRREIAPQMPPEVRDALNIFWKDCDFHHTSIMDYMGQPAQYARRFGTGWSCVDKQPISALTEADEMLEGARPYVYVVPTENVLWWQFDEDGDDLEIAVIATPKEGQGILESAIRVWTEKAWANYDFVRAQVPKEGDQAPAKPSSPKGNYVLRDFGVNPLGEVPLVPLFNINPGRGRAFGKTEMLDVARIAKTVFNLDSEAREIERNCAFPFLGVPVKDIATTEVAKMYLGTETMVLYDGNSGEPRWVTPDLVALDKIAAKIEAKKQRAYEMAELSAIAGHIQTSSGFHSEVEFDKTDRRIGQFAAAAEEAENKIARLVLKYQFANMSEKMLGDAFSIVYPREFNVRDLERMIARTVQILALNAGDEVNVLVFRDLFSVLWPRKSKEDIDRISENAAKNFQGIGQGAAAGALPGAAPGAPAGAAPKNLALQTIDQTLRRFVGQGAVAELKAADA